MRRQPGQPWFLVSRHDRLWLRVWAKKCIGLALSRPDECMSSWLWHGLLSQITFHPQHRVIILHKGLEAKSLSTRYNRMRAQSHVIVVVQVDMPLAHHAMSEADAFRCRV